MFADYTGPQSDGGRPHRPRSSPTEDTRLRTPPREVAGAELLALIDCAASYHCYDRNSQLIQVLDARRAQVLISRRLLVGRVDRKLNLTFWTAAGVTASQVKNVMRLKPPATSICNRATVVKVLPTTWTHRASLAVGL
jgi:hypothetical protein